MNRTDYTTHSTNIKSDCFSGCPEDMLLAYTAQPWQFRLVDDGVELWYNSDTGKPTIDAATSGHIDIPSTLCGLHVVSIGEEAFSGCDQLTSVTIPETVTSIGDEAFCDCDGLADANGFIIVQGVLYDYIGPATDVKIPDGVTRIGAHAFLYKTSIKTVTIPATVTSIGTGAFQACINLESIVIPDGVKIIEEGVFQNCNALKSVTIPDSVTSIGEDAFRYCIVLESVTIPDSVKDIGEQAFAECWELKEVTIPNSVTSIGENAFLNDGSLKTVVVSNGESGNVAQLLEKSGFKVDSSITFKEDVPKATWFTTKAEAMAEAKKTGKKIFMICGRDTCWNTMTTKNVSCEDPTVKDILTAKCVLWYTNCDTQREENLCYWPEGEFNLPVVCIIDPNYPDSFTARSTGYKTAEEVLALLYQAPIPSNPFDSSNPSDPPAIDPEYLDPFYPGEMTGYKVLNPADIWDPIRAPKAVTLMGAAYYGNDVVGIVELKVGKLNKNLQAKVSGSVTLLDGKKYTIKSETHGFGDKLASTLTLDVKGGGRMRIAIGSMGGVNVFSGELGKWHVQTANVGMGWSKSTATVTMDLTNLDSLPSGILEALLPTNEVATASGGKWKFKKAANVKWTKIKAGMVPLVQDANAGKGLVVDTSKDKTNLSGLKLTYTPKKGTFKGSFKLYELKGAKLKKYTVNVNGVVVDGVGYGKATCKKPSFTWSVTVK